MEGNSQKLNSLGDNSIKIVRNHKKVKIPQLYNEELCGKISKIIIPNSIKFTDDDGQKLYYRLSFELQFDAYNNIIEVRLHGNNNAVKEVAEQVMFLLKHSKWKGKNSSD